MDEYAIRKLAAQVAVEAVANDRFAYDLETIAAVLSVAREAGVSDFYLDMIR